MPDRSGRLRVDPISSNGLHVLPANDRIPDLDYLHGYAAFQLAGESSCNAFGSEEMLISSNQLPTKHKLRP